jgi:hypothetical protein
MIPKSPFPRPTDSYQFFPIGIFGVLYNSNHDEKVPIGKRNLNGSRRTRPFGTPFVSIQKLDGKCIVSELFPIGGEFVRDQLYRRTFSYGTP